MFCWQTKKTEIFVLAEALLENSLIEILLEFLIRKMWIMKKKTKIGSNCDEKTKTKRMTRSSDKKRNEKIILGD